MLRIPLPSDVPEGPLDIVVMISSSHPALPASGLAGRWKAFFPPDFDIDRALNEIRHDWEASSLDKPETDSVTAHIWD